MTKNRLSDYIDHIRQAADDAYSYTEGMTHQEFLEDKKTQQAVILNLIIIGEAATKVMDDYESYTRETPEIPWRSMRNMRNRLAHGYFDINLDIVWDTVKTWLPSLMEQDFKLRD